MSWFEELFINEAKPALNRHSGSGGGEANIKSLSVTKNGTYTAPSGVDGYSPVQVNIPVPEYDIAEGVNF